ncbi:MAG: hypothetical protein RIE56_01145 [Amphiplicatus sp.]
MDWRSIPAFALAALFTFVFHEGAHFAMGEALGYDMWVRLNSAGLAGGAYASALHENLVSAAGPAATLLQGVVAFAAAMAWRSRTAFAFLFMALVIRFLAAGVSLFNPNDEARIGEWLGVGPWALFAAVISFLLLLAMVAGRRLDLGWKSYIFSWLVSSHLVAAVVFGEAYLPALGL